MNKRTKPDIEITEMFMAKADWNRIFFSSIQRYTSEDGADFVVGRIPVHEYEILASARNDVELGRKLDELVMLLLEKVMH